MDVTQPAAGFKHCSYIGPTVEYIPPWGTLNINEKRKKAVRRHDGSLCTQKQPERGEGLSTCGIRKGDQVHLGWAAANVSMSFPVTASMTHVKSVHTW